MWGGGQLGGGGGLRGWSEVGSLGGSRADSLKKELEKLLAQEAKRGKAPEQTREVPASEPEAKLGAGGGGAGDGEGGGISDAEAERLRREEEERIAAVEQMLKQEGWE